ncbi:hypothetical protein PsorP6_013028 [Peronosclerospora sorghi]|uniref:Uncharacterized protein n=1 Tax=Peronosclerospora sorghi TaxID=230839 RepID=A0ACC0WIS8_9STRA|nr:hypothetical protein PsorP6_013028 [Peronosclerospora sorghi]
MAARNVIRFLKSANIYFSSFDQRASGACEFYRQMTAEKVTYIGSRIRLPYLDGQYNERFDLFVICGTVNGSKQVLEVPNKKVGDIFDEVDFHCSQIETEYEEQGKSIE